MMPITLADIITSDGYQQAFPKNYYKSDCLVENRPILWRGENHSPPSLPTTLIVAGHSDYGITDDIVNRYNPTVLWCINKQSELPNVHALPLGITNHSFELAHHPYGDLNVIIQVRDEPKIESGLCFMNFAVHTYPQERQAVWDRFEREPWVSKGTIVNTVDGRREFLRQIRSHTFVLCPRGNGVDTHRLWETLYMGSIPVVRRDVAYAEFEEYFPICFVDDWSEVTPEFLAQKNVLLRSDARYENYEEKLKIGWWITHMNRTRAE